MRNFLREILAILGFGAAVYGIYLMHVPLSLLIGGGFLLWLTIPTRSKKGGK